LVAKLTADPVTTNPKRTFMETRLRLIFCLFLIDGVTIVLARIVTAEAMDPSDR